MILCCVLWQPHCIRPCYILPRYIINGLYCQSPDFVWHLDGYDKMKPYGFAIYGCMNGWVYSLTMYIVAMYLRYSRKIIWLDVTTSNNDPNLVLHLYLLVVLEIYGTLCLLSGPQTNCIIMCMYCYLIIYIRCPRIIRSDCGTEKLFKWH